MSLSSKDSVSGRQILLDDVTVQRKVPFNDHGNHALRCIRKHLEDELAAESDAPISLPYPTVIHLVLLDYAAIKGVPLDVTKE
jgi:hypothetical protein